MDLTAFAKDTLAKQGPAGAQLALAALNGDKDEVIRLLIASSPPLLMPVDELKAQLAAEKAQLAAEKARSAQLAKQLEQLQEDSREAADSWHRLGNGLSWLLGRSWDFDNDALLEVMTQHIANPTIRIGYAETDRLKSQISDLEAIIASYSARELLLQSELKRLQGSL